MEAENYDSNALIPCDDNCNGEIGDCCEYSLNNNFNNNLESIYIANTFPNPFNPEINININSPYSDKLKIEVYDLSGKKIQTLYDSSITIGMHSFVWNAKDRQSGIYVLKVSMNLVFIYLGEECLVIIYSVSELAMGKVPVCFEPEYQFANK